MKNLLLLIVPILFFSCSNSNSVSVESPNGKLQLNFWLDESSDNYYSVSYEGEELIVPSLIGFELESGDTIGKNVELISTSTKSVEESWKPVYGELAKVPNVYKQTTLRLRKTSGTEMEYQLTFRVYDEGVAFNVTFLPTETKNDLTIQKELTEFNFSQDYMCWISDRAQSEYRKVSINDVAGPAERPLLIEAGKRFIAIGEAKLIDFSRMKLQSGQKPNSLITTLHDAPSIQLPYTTPWRTIMVGNSAGELLENNYFLQNLNDPCEIENTSWIKPGKVIREVTLTTRGGIACVDFAVKNNLQYVEFDAGWYGPEYDDSSDATTISVDPKRSPGPLDLHKVIDYAASKDIGIILYVNRRALEKQLDEILPLFNSWGIKGVKYGFVQVGSQEWTTWLHDAVKKAADNQLMVDIHDEYRPTGFSRTYPNLMTQEGIRGDEESPSNQHTLTTLFTRMLAGAGDNTICYYAPRVEEKMGGHVSQLAKAVLMYSPWQFLFWYDRPPNSSDVVGGVPGGEDFIVETPELEFFKNMPTVWNDTKVLESKIAEYATIARRNGNDWFLGSLTGENQHFLQLDLSFLDADINYEATIYSYDSDSKIPTKVGINKKEVDKNSTLDFEIKANSGLAIYFKQL